MAININDSNVQQFHRTSSNPLSKSNGNAKNINSAQTPATTDVSKQTPSDSVTLTNPAINLNKLEESIAHLPIVDMQKVEEVKQQIKDGSYTINPDKIAQRFIEMEIALSG